MRFNDAVFGVILLIFSTTITVIAQTTFPELPGQNYGPAFFPSIIGAVLFGCGVILLARGIARRKSEPLVQLGEWARMPRYVVNFALVFVALLVFILFTDTVGFIPISFLIFVVLLSRFGCRPWTSVVIGIVATLVIHTAFYKFLLVPLPWGILEPFEW